MNEKSDRLKKGEVVARNATIVTILLAFAKFFVGIFTGSIVLIADAFHSTVDILTIAASWIGLWISRKKPTEKFPYGFYKAENLATFFIASIVLYLAFNLLVEGAEKIFTTSTMEFGFIAAIVSFLSSIVSLVISNYEIKVGKEINSDSLIINGKESRMDVISSVVVMFTIILTMFGIPYIEGIVTILISLLIFKIGIGSIKDSVFALMDVSPSKEIEKEVRRILRKFPIESFTELKLRKSGPFVFGEVRVKLKGHIDVTRAHEISEKIENEIRKNIPEISSFSVYIEPTVKLKKILIPVESDEGLDSKVMSHFGRSNYFMFIELNEKGEMKKYYVKENPYRTKKMRAGLSVAHFALGEKIDTLVTSEMGEISFHTLRDNFVNIYKSKGKTVREVLDNLLKGNLEKMTKPTRKKD